MKTVIGIIADLHDNLANFYALVRQNPHLAALWCAGDIGSPETYAAMARTVTVPIRAVAGNLEEDIGLAGYRSLEQQFPHLTFVASGRLAFSYAGYQVDVLHCSPDSPQSRVRQSRPQIVVSGHTHRPSLRRSVQGWQVNPGALAGYPHPATYALLTFVDGQPQFALKRLYE